MSQPKKTIAHYIPSPFSLAIILSISVIILAISVQTDKDSGIVDVFQYWVDGIWNSSLLVFGYQMMLILVLGHVLALSGPVQRLLNLITGFVTSTAQAVIFVSISCMLIAFFNWGLGLIFGAILARKIGEKSQKEDFSINYPLVGASGYVGLLVWHGGISGSAPLKVSEAGHLRELLGNKVINLPDVIPATSTIFSTENLLIFGLFIIFVPALLLLISRKKSAEKIDQDLSLNKSVNTEKTSKPEHQAWFSKGFGLLILIAWFFAYQTQWTAVTITPNMLNLLMLSLGLLFHKNLDAFSSALKTAIKGASGILIQFPLYFGIMGILSSSGMIEAFAMQIASWANKDTLPLFTFISAGIVNFFVPSGGGQWAIQGPINIMSAQQLDVPLHHQIMAFAYGDQVTNMLQPFWALPLLAITKLKAQQILPYTVVLFLLGSILFIIGILIIY
ncbi:MAG: TIGR00366 family protein [Psychroflexus sp.]|jgi:short-chain fatty acids transporter|nr:TIGR00366 family protein [Psychroflexus sp.]